jgi:hypothetical protein
MTEEQLIDSLGRQVERYVNGAPDADVLIRTLGTLTAYTLATVMRAAHMMPDDIEQFLDDFCATLRQAVVEIVRTEDAEDEP